MKYLAGLLQQEEMIAVEKPGNWPALTQRQLRSMKS